MDLIAHGKRVTGTPEELARFLNHSKTRITGRHGDSTFYHSSTKGYVVIREMHSGHIRNAVLKIIEDTLDRMRTSPTEHDFIDIFTELLEDKTVISLLSELEKRGER